MADVKKVSGIFWYYCTKRRSNRSNGSVIRKKPNSFSSHYAITKRHRLLLIQAILAATNKPRSKIVWQYPRSNTWFEMVKESYTEELWYQNFRVTKETFTFILSEICGQISRQDTSMRKAISTETRLAVTLYYLASTAEFRTIAHLFGVSTSFVCICVKEVSEAVNQKLSGIINFPHNDDLVQVMAGYEEKWGIPMCAGAIDGTHIPILAPEESHTDYINRKGYHSIIMQAVVDCNYRFRDVVIGWPGSVHDARVLSNSLLYKKGMENQLFPGIQAKQIHDQDIFPFLIGDPAYPLLPWLMKPYPENSSTPTIERVFNYSLSRARMTVEDTFGRWKGRFSRFSKRVDMRVSSLINLTKASCILHNLCEIQNNTFLPEWEQTKSSFQEPTVSGDQGIERTDSEDVRSTLAEYFSAQQAC